MQDLGGWVPALTMQRSRSNDNTATVGRSCLDSLKPFLSRVSLDASRRDAGSGDLRRQFQRGNRDQRGWPRHRLVNASRRDSPRFLWTAQTGMQELLPNETFESFPWAINDSDQVAGAFNDPQDTQSHAFSWTPSTGLQDLGTLGSGFSEALAINDSGDVVWIARTADNTGYSVIWKKGGTIRSSRCWLTPIILFCLGSCHGH